MIVSIVILILLVIIELYGLKYEKEPVDIMDYRFTNVLRGICCFPVIFSHIYAPYDNSCQSRIGSYAFIAVTLYFIFSAYGLEISVQKKADYLSNFFKKRFSSILIPYIICIVFRLLFRVNWSYGGANFVHVLLVYYIIFYVAHTKILETKKREKFLLLCTLGYSVGGFFLGYKLRLPKIGLNWYPESLGLTLGVLLAYHYNEINSFFKTKIKIKTVVFFLLAAFMKYTYINYIYEYYFIGNYLYRMAMGITVIIFIVLLCSHVKLGNRVSNRLGRCSFEIFLYHGFSLQILEKLPIKWTSDYYILAVFIFTIVLAVCMNRVGVRIIKKVIERE